MRLKIKIIEIFVMIVLISVCVYSSAAGERSNAPFEKYERLKFDKYGFYSENQLPDMLKSYGIYDKILDEIGSDSYDMRYASAAISPFRVGNKNVAVMLIQVSGLQLYIMFSSSGGVWKADGFTYQSERADPEYRIEQNDDGKYWLAVKHETVNGTGTDAFDEIWHNPDGSVAVEYPSSENALIDPENAPGARVEFTSGTSVDKTGLSVYYTITFSYPYGKNFVSVYTTQESRTYDLDGDKFTMSKVSAGLPEDVVSGGDSNSVFTKYFELYKERTGSDTITSLDDWERFIDIIY